MEKNEWKPGWLSQVICLAFAALWIFGPKTDAGAASSFIAASFIIGVIRQLHKANP